MAAASHVVRSGLLAPDGMTCHVVIEPLHDLLERSGFIGRSVEVPVRMGRKQIFGGGPRPERVNAQQPNQFALSMVTSPARGELGRLRGAGSL